MWSIFSVYVLLATIVLSGCAAGAKDPDSANTFEVLFGDNVQQHLENRRAQLGRLKARAASLDDEILPKLGQLQNLENELKAARARTGASNRDLAEFQQEVEEQKAKAEATFQRASSLQSRVKELETEVNTAKHNQKRDTESIESLNQEISKLEEENVVLDRAIERNLNRKAAELLR